MAQLFTHCWRENREIHAFHMVISAKLDSTAISKIWTQISNFLSYKNNLYTKETCKKGKLIILKLFLVQPSMNI